MTPHSSFLAWIIPWTVEPGGLPSMGSHRVGHDWSDLAAATLSLPHKPYLTTLCIITARCFFLSALTNVLCISMAQNVYIYIYIYVCVCVCVCELENGHSNLALTLHLNIILGNGRALYIHIYTYIYIYICIYIYSQIDFEGLRTRIALLISVSWAFTVNSSKEKELNKYWTIE